MKKITILIAVLIIFSSLVSAFSFADLFSGNLLNIISGKSVINRGPETGLGAPSDNQVVSGKFIKFKWNYNDAEGDEQQNYILQIDDEFGFYSPFTYYGLKEILREVHIPTGDGKYYWRVKSKDAYSWGGWSETRVFYMDASEKICNDGTAYWECSREKPKYCDAGKLKEDCKTCGCQANAICEETGVCTGQTCSDGTFYGACSNEKPKYCQIGTLVKICSFCGCPDGKECLATGECADTIVNIGISEAEKEIKLSLIQRIVHFFRGLFG